MLPAVDLHTSKRVACFGQEFMMQWRILTDKGTLQFSIEVHKPYNNPINRTNLGKMSSIRTWLRSPLHCRKPEAEYRVYWTIQWALFCSISIHSTFSHPLYLNPIFSIELLSNCWCSLACLPFADRDSVCTKAAVHVTCLSNHGDFNRPSNIGDGQHGA
jgi:hypothetical protein